MCEQLRYSSSWIKHVLKETSKLVVDSCWIGDCLCVCLVNLLNEIIMTLML